MTPICGPAERAPTLAGAIADPNRSSSTRNFSGSKSSPCSRSPPRGVSTLASAPKSGTIHTSPNEFVGETACRSLKLTSIPSRGSSNEIPSSTDIVGGTSPPSPIVTGAGSGLPLDSLTVVGLTISVSGRSPVPAETNSLTRPATFTASPTVTVGAVVPVKTKMPSLVCGSLSGLVSCMKYPCADPPVLTAVTTPSTPETALPSSGERWPEPWIVWIATGGVLVVIVQTKLALIVSGGSTESSSCTAEPVIVVVHVSPNANGLSGWRTYVVLVCEMSVAVCSCVVEQSIVNQLASRCTGSLKMTVRFVDGSTPEALFAGLVDDTDGAASPGTPVRGLGSPTVRSAALSFSVHRPVALAERRRRVGQCGCRPGALEAIRARAEADEVDYGRRADGAARDRGLVRNERDLAAVPDRLIDPVAFGVGRFAVPFAPAASWIR